MMLQAEADAIIHRAMRSIVDPPHVTQPMRVVCSYCLTVIKAGPPQPISHGICGPCFARLNAELDALEAVSETH